MFRVEDQVQVIRDGRIGKIKNTRGRIDAANTDSAVEVLENCLVCFDNDITKAEWFKPEELRPAK